MTEEGQIVVAPNKSLANLTVYEPLDSKLDCTRFVEIEPSTDDGAKISCKLLHVSFGQRPNFVALSYMWGESKAQKKILLNGAEFAVTQNLMDALHHLRGKNTSKGKLFWIDAICINQDDSSEKSRQVRIMHHIYERARSVIVWLGERYRPYQYALSSDDLQEKAEAHGSNMSTENTEICEDLVRETATASNLASSLASDEYWSRLWIIQELGKARLLKVCFGNWEWPWQNFIHFLTMHDHGQDGPLRLNRQLREAPHRSHFICDLLRDHEGAVCKNRKDKIYGLVGLAADAVGFPINYSKSLEEIWVDTMEFLNRRGLLTESEYIPFGRLVKSLLMGDVIPQPLDQVKWLEHQRDIGKMPPIVQDLDSSGFSRNSDARVFQIQSHMLGFIHTLGPSVQDVVANLKSVDEWRSSVQSFSRENLGPANEESNALIRGILYADDTQLSSLSLRLVGNVAWQLNFAQRKDLDMRTAKLLGNPTSTRKSGHGPSTVNESDIHRLYQMTHLTEQSLPWRMGVVHSQAQRGSLVCWVSGISNAILVHLTQPVVQKDGPVLPPFARVFGTAAVTEDLARAVAEANFDHEDRFKLLARYWTGDKERSSIADFPIRVDAWTLLALLGA